MENKLNLSVILPVKSSLVRDFDEFFKKAIQSIQNQSVKLNELVIVHSSEKTLIDYLESFDFGDLEVNKIEFKDEPNYSSQINLGVKSAKSEWVSLFEFDDEYSQIWFKMLKNILRFIRMLTHFYL